MKWYNRSAVTPKADDSEYLPYNKQKAEAVISIMKQMIIPIIPDFQLMVILMTMVSGINTQKYARMP